MGELLKRNLRQKLPKTIFLKKQIGVGISFPNPISVKKFCFHKDVRPRISRKFAKISLWSEKLKKNLFKAIKRDTRTIFKY